MRSLLLFCLLITVNVQAAFYPPTVSKDGMVVSDQYLASQIGANILKQGGNAIDAAVAVGYALAVVDPCCGNIGGGGFMLIHLHTGQNLVLDFRETAPQKITAQLFLDKSGKVKPRNKLGYLLIGIPGTVMGLNTVLKKYGTLTLKQVIAPAIKLAKEGFVLNRFDAETLQNSDFQQENVKAIFMPSDHLLQPGQRLIQKNLASTLEAISQHGSQAFYQGEIAKKIVASAKQHNGIISMHDMKNYQVIWRKPLTCNYRGYQVLSAPPPSSGATICEILKIVNKYPLSKLGFRSVKSLHYNIAAMNQSFYDRNHFLGDPNFTSDPTKELLSDTHIKQIQTNIENGKITPVKNLEKTNHSMQTTNYVVMDKQGNVVVTTYTINSAFGSQLIAGDTGFFLNNELDDFSIKSGSINQFNLTHSKANLIAPNKRPLSSMSPTLVFKGNKVFMALGAAGGPTIITCIVEAIENVIDYGMNIRAAINIPRYHTQYSPNLVYMEPFAISPTVISLLTKIGYTLQHLLFGEYQYWGVTNGILIDNETNGSADNRRPNSRAVGVGQIKKIKMGSQMF